MVNDGGQRGRLPRLPLLPLLPLGAVGLGGCELTEVTVEFGEPVVIVQAIMRPDLPTAMLGRQFVVVERTFTGDTEPIEDPETGDTFFQPDEHFTIPYGGVPALPLEDATVTIANLDYANDPCGATVLFTPDPETNRLPQRPGLYWGPRNCPTMRPGDRLALRVVTPAGDTVTGVTRIPGLQNAQFSVGGVTRDFDPMATTFNRDRDTLHFAVDAAAGRLVQLEVRRRTDLTDFGTKIFVDTTAFSLPGDVINSFVIGDEDAVFRAGREYAVTIAVTDTNYFDFARSDNNRYTGRGFINRLEGGLGVFGSMVARTTVLRAVGDVDDEREGVYRLQGGIPRGPDTLDVDLTWELYLNRTTDTTEFSAFVEGDWLYGPIDTNADGRFDGSRFTAAVVDTALYVRSDSLRGRWHPTDPFSVALVINCPPEGVETRCEEANRFLGVLEMVKQ